MDEWYKRLAVALVCKSYSRLRIVRTWQGGKDIKEAKPARGWRWLDLKVVHIKKTMK